MSLSVSSTPVSIAKRERVDYVLYVTDDGEAFDLSGATIVLEARDNENVLLFQKVSADDTQIEILDQTSEDLIGQAAIHFVGGDTEDLEVNDRYWLDVWIYRNDNRVEQVVAKQRLHVTPVVHEPDTSPPSASPGPPLPQTEYDQRFLFEWPDTSDEAVVPIPIPMYDDTYIVSHEFTTLIDDEVAILRATDLTQTSFKYLASGTLQAGTILMVRTTDE